MVLQYIQINQTYTLDHILFYDKISNFLPEKSNRKRNNNNSHGSVYLRNGSANHHSDSECNSLPLFLCIAGFLDGTAFVESSQERVDKYIKNSLCIPTRK